MARKKKAQVVTEVWLFKNPEALAAVRRGIADAAAGRISKVDLDTL